MGREVSLGETPGRMAFLALLGVALGGVGGVAASLVVRLVGLISNLALLHRVAFGLPDLAHYHPTPALIPIALGGAVVVVALAFWTPVIKGHGIPESLEAIAARESRIKPRVLLAKPLSAAVAMGTGGPFGAEGPIIVTGGCVGSLLGQWLRVSPAERRILLATGAAAGMAGVFSTPIAAVVLAFELLLFERSLRALLPLLLATGIAAEVHTLLLGARPLFAVTRPLAAPAAQLPLFALLGVAVGALAIVVNKGLFAAEAGFRRLPLPEACHPLLGALAFALIGLAVPGSLSVGYWAIRDAVNGRFLLVTAAALFLAKLVSWWIALASNTSGGTLAPIFLIGATMGEAVGLGFAHLFPSEHIEPAAFALVAMGAAFGVAARALLTGAVFALEVTGAYHLVVPMLLVLGVAEVIAQRGLTQRLMTDKLARRGYRVEFDAEVDPFRTATAGQVMERLPADDAALDGPSIDRFAHVRDALAVFLSGGAESVTVTDHGAPIGVLTREAMAAVLARRIAESRPQAPSLRWRGGGVAKRWPWRGARRPRAGQTPRSDIPASAPRREQARGVDGEGRRAAGPRFTSNEYESVLRFRTRLRQFLAWSAVQAHHAGITAAQHQFLLAVQGHPGSSGPTISEIAEYLQLRHESAAGLVEEMEAAGLARREFDPHDGGIARIKLQPRGETSLEELTVAHVPELRSLTSGEFLPHLPGKQAGP